jgi:HAD superfamily hydrolase (TIGR01509 family)
VIKAVVFDMDGVLTDTEPVINTAAIRGLREYGVEAEPDDFLPFVGAGEDKYIGGVAELYGKVYKPEMKTRVYEIYLKILPGMINPIPGVDLLLRQLRQAGVPMAVATSADRIKMEANLAAINVPLDWFNGIVVAEDVAHKKPAPDIYLAAAAKLDLPPAQCCVVEDAVNGVEAAKAAGMRCVAVESSFPAARLQTAGPDVIRPAIAEITLNDLGIAGS